MDAIFNGIFDGALTQNISVGNFLLCLGVSLLLGLVMAAAYMYKNEQSSGFLITLALLPAVVCVVIMMVNGNFLWRKPSRKSIRAKLRLIKKIPRI